MTVKVGDLRMKCQRVSAENCVYDSVDFVSYQGINLQQSPAESCSACLNHPPRCHSELHSC